MREVEIGRVCSSWVASVPARNARADTMGEHGGNALEAILSIRMKRMLKPVVEVRYTTGTQEVAG
jgi:hypothetical protein